MIHALIAQDSIYINASTCARKDRPSPSIKHIKEDTKRQMIRQDIGNSQHEQREGETQSYVAEESRN